MIQQILQDEIKSRNISAREVARQSGVAHTTIMRILEGKNVDLDTLNKISDWLNVDVSYLVDLNNKDNVASRIAAVLDKNSQLKVVFLDLIEKLNSQEIDSRDLEDIMVYIAFRLKYSRKI